jgi:hypothetical protein
MPGLLEAKGWCRLAVHQGSRSHLANVLILRSGTSNDDHLPMRDVAWRR